MRGEYHGYPVHCYQFIYILVNLEIFRSIYWQFFFQVEVKIDELNLVLTMQMTCFWMMILLVNEKYARLMPNTIYLYCRNSPPCKRSIVIRPFKTSDFMTGEWRALICKLFGYSIFFYYLVVMLGFLFKWSWNFF